MSESLQTGTENLFFDPFAEVGAEAFDPVAAHQKLWERYRNDEVRHDYTADKFVSDTQALMMDAAFVGRFREAEMIAAQMHNLCGEDHGLRQSIQSHEFFSGAFADSDRHPHDHDAQSSQKSEEKSKKKKDKKQYRGWLDILSRG